MDRDDKYLAHIMFQNKIYTSDAQAFENLFITIMGQRYSNFQAVKPQGSLGDMKNDGYLIDEGTFYQVYGPEDLAKSIDSAIKKLQDDFNGLLEKWDTNIEIKKFYYVVNDKYKGAFPTVHQKILELKRIINMLQESSGIEVGLITAKDLENIFFELSEFQIINIIGLLPNTKSIYNLNYDALNNVIEHIMALPGKSYNDDLYIPDFDEKITFNGLSRIIKIGLQRAGFNYGDLEIYFNNNGDFLREDIKDRFKKLYDQSKEEIKDDEENFADRRYMYILEKSSPNKDDSMIQQAIECLMAYYFESCDIFEQPNDWRR